ncbi:MAG: UDP-N-acetylmuramoyl-tripeptide--D-alanyl-D-alanine ligase [Rickettsiella sp.]|nr:UDP-N-acetylmuramoyl-tripeptide--D-alanyl-D-alanine ligase [Rickettsiella sp.]
MKLSILASILEGQLIGQDLSFNSVSLDSRSIKPGALFVAISGEKFDGHSFIEEAKKQGAVAALVHQAVSTELPLIRVADTRKAYGQLARAHREKFSIPVIALTGSCGKTTTKEMLRAILSECGPVLASSKNFNNDIGVPLTLLDLNAQHRFVVIEMGANHIGEIANLTQITKPDVALITNIAPAHLEGFGSIEKVAQAKSEIFLGLTTNGVAIVNVNDRFENTWRDRLANHRVIRFGLGTDFSASDIHLDTEGRVQFTLLTPKGKIKINLVLPGQHNLFNALAAAAVAIQVGASLGNIKAGLQKMQDVPGRLMILKNKDGITIIDDSYNASPNAVKAALELLAHYPGERIFVMGDMGELGANADYYHRQIGQLAKQLGINHVYTCGELTALTTQAFGSSAKHFRNQEDLIHALRTLLRSNTDVTVLIKGSRTAKMEKVVTALVH